MSDAITPDEFEASPGVGDWRVEDGVAVAEFATGSFVTGVDLVTAVRDLAEEANHHPDVDLRYPSVTIRLVSHDIEGLSRRDADLAARISEAARGLGVEASR